MDSGLANTNSPAEEDRLSTRLLAREKWSSNAVKTPVAPFTNMV